MEIERSDYRETITELAKITWVDISEYQKHPEKQAAAKSEREKFILLNKRIQAIFTSSFKKSSAEQYCLEGRKLTHKTIDAFWLWYAPDSHYTTIQILKEKWFSNDDLIKAWLAKQWNRGDIYAFFRHRLTFPIHNHLGIIVGFGARSLNTDQNPKYLNTTETPLYDKSKILYWLDKAKQHMQTYNALIVVEWYMDVLALHQYWLPIWIATCGTALTVDHVKRIKRTTENIYLAFDNDNAWFEATMRGLKIAYQEDLFPRVIPIPAPYKDIDEYLTKNNTVNFEQLQENSHDWFSFVIEKLLSNKDASNPVIRKQIIEQLFEVIRYVENYTIFSLYIETIANAFKTQPESILKQCKQFLSAKRIPKLQEKKQWTVDMHIVIWSLIYKNYLKSQNLLNDSIEKFLETIKKLASLQPQSMLNQIHKDTVDDALHQTLLEQQLLREHARWSASHEKIQTGLINDTLPRFIRDYKRNLLKTSWLSHTQKQAIMEL